LGAQPRLRLHQNGAASTQFVNASLNVPLQLEAPDWLDEGDARSLWLPGKALLVLYLSLQEQKPQGSLGSPQTAPRR